MAKAAEEYTQVSSKAKRKIRENTHKNSQTLNTLDQTYFLDISIGSISNPKISNPNKSIIESKNLKSPFFDKLKTFFKPDKSIIIAGDKFEEIIGREIQEERNLAARNKLRKGNRQY